MKNYDVIIVGGGPAGLTASIYALRSGRSVLMIEGNVIGGQSSASFEIANYPGIELITGIDLAMKMHAQAEKLGLVTEYDSVKKIDCANKLISTTSSDFKADCIILAMGAKPRKLNLKNEAALTGCGVHYCATCDGSFYKGKKVIVVGGGNTAVEDAIYLANICSEVTMVVRSDKLRSDDVFEERLKSFQSQGKLNILFNTRLSEIITNNQQQIVGAKISVNGKEEKIDIDGVFIAIGRDPDVELIKDQILLNEKGYIVANEKMHTNIEGVFVAGDIREKDVRQIITACADGAIAGIEANHYLNCKRG